MCEAVEKLLKEAAEEGFKIGRAEGRNNVILELLHTGNISMDVACTMLNKSPSEIQSLLDKRYA